VSIVPVFFTDIVFVAESPGRASVSVKALVSVKVSFRSPVVIVLYLAVSFPVISKLK